MGDATSLTGGWIAAIVVPSVAFAIAALLGFWWFARRFKKSSANSRKYQYSRSHERQSQNADRHNHHHHHQHSNHRKTTINSPNSSRQNFYQSEIIKEDDVQSFGMNTLNSSLTIERKKDHQSVEELQRKIVNRKERRIDVDGSNNNNNSNNNSNVRGNTEKIDEEEIENQPSHIEYIKRPESALLRPISEPLQRYPSKLKKSATIDENENEYEQDTSPPPITEESNIDAPKLDYLNFNNDSPLMSTDLLYSTNSMPKSPQHHQNYHRHSGDNSNEGSIYSQRASLHDGRSVSNTIYSQRQKANKQRQQQQTTSSVSLRSTLSRMSNKSKLSDRSLETSKRISSSIISNQTKTSQSYHHNNTSQESQLIQRRGSSLSYSSSIKTGAAAAGAKMTASERRMILDRPLPIQPINQSPPVAALGTPEIPTTPSSSSNRQKQPNSTTSNTPSLIITKNNGTTLPASIKSTTNNNNNQVYSSTSPYTTYETPVSTTTMFTAKSNISNEMDKFINRRPPSLISVSPPAVVPERRPDHRMSTPNILRQSADPSISKVPQAPEVPQLDFGQFMKQSLQSPYSIQRQSSSNNSNPIYENLYQHTPPLSKLLQQSPPAPATPQTSSSLNNSNSNNNRDLAHISAPPMFATPPKFPVELGLPFESETNQEIDNENDEDEEMNEAYTENNEYENQDVLLLCRAVHNYSPKLDDELELKKGDWLIVYEIFDDGWCFAKLLDESAKEQIRAGLIEGICPKACLAVMDQK